MLSGCPRPPRQYLVSVISPRTKALVAGGILTVGLALIWFCISEREEANFTASNGMEMVWVEPMRGWVGKYLVTQDEYQKVMGSNPSFFKGSRRPVEEVSWYDAVAYCQKLTEQDHARGVLSWFLHYDLPNASQYNIFVGDASLADAVTSVDQWQKSTADVGSKGANQYGLYDTRGNLWIWCQGWCQGFMNKPDYMANPAKYENYPTSKRLRLVRGGCWSNATPVDVGISHYAGAVPEKRDQYTGFRCVLAP